MGVILPGAIHLSNSAAASCGSPIRTPSLLEYSINPF